MHTLMKVILFYEFGTPKIKEEGAVPEPNSQHFCTASTLYALVVIIQSHDVIYKRKKLNMLGDIRRSATIGPDLLLQTELEPEF